MNCVLFKIAPAPAPPNSQEKKSYDVPETIINHTKWPTISFKGTVE
jgi:hypothetical protein